MTNSQFSTQHGNSKLTVCARLGPRAAQGGRSRLDRRLDSQIFGPTVDFFGAFPPPAEKISCAIFKPSGTPPMFCERSISPLFLTAKASKTQCTPRYTRLLPFSSIICHRPLGNERTCRG